jgi:sulfate adenylyltransferase large subunit
MMAQPQWNRKNKRVIFNMQTSPLSQLRFITCGSVDDGKSTLIGRLLYESGNLFEDQNAALLKDSAKFGTQGTRPDYALLVDGLAAEREQGITIDVAYRYFSTPRRKFIVADTPGHEQYTRNMATGASTAQLAILLIDARKGLLPQTRRHAFILAMLGIKHLIIAVNKMDLVGYEEKTFNAIKNDFEKATSTLSFLSKSFIPLSALEGDNLFVLSRAMPWYKGQTLIHELETIDVKPVVRDELRFPVQWVNRPNLDFRGFSGTISSGQVKVGEMVQALPSQKQARVKEIFTPQGQAQEAKIGAAITLTLDREIDISRGDLLVAQKDPLTPVLGAQVQLLNMSERALLENGSFIFKNGVMEVPVTLTKIIHKINIETYAPQSASVLKLNEIASVDLSFGKPALLDSFKNNQELGSFILIDRYSHETVALGTVTQVIKEKQLLRTSPREGVSRSFVKAVSWRTIGTIDTFLLSWFFTGSSKLAAGISLAEVVTKTALYYFHERAWARSSFGLKRAENKEGDGI